MTKKMCGYKNSQHVLYCLVFSYASNQTTLSSLTTECYCFLSSHFHIGNQAGNRSSHQPLALSPEHQFYMFPVTMQIRFILSTLSIHWLLPDVETCVALRKPLLVPVT